MRTVDLACYDYGDFAALIVAHPSGVSYSNQCGGSNCAHPALEGVMIPLPSRVGVGACRIHIHDLFGSASSMNPWSPSGDDAKTVAEFLGEQMLGVVFDESFTGEWGEAWIPVRVVSADPSSTLADFIGYTGILTYCNSD